MQIKVGDQLLHYEMVHPQGTTKIVILHGWGHSGSMWQLVSQLLPDNCCCCLLDLPGFGQSPLLHAMSLDDYVEVVIGFIKKLELRQVVLLGHSFGGQLAVSVASRHDIEKLILIAPALKRERNKFGSTWYKFLGFVAKLKRILPRSLTYQLSSGLNYSEASPRLKQVFRNLIKIDVTQTLLNITIPTLCIWGEYDKEILGSGKQIVGRLSQGRLKVIYDAGHNLHLEKPKQVARLIERFV